MEIISMLDQLAEFQAQRDLIEMRKRELLDEVKVPAAVIAAQEAAHKRRQELDDQYRKVQRELNEQAQSEMEAVPMPELPAEYQQALEAAKQKRAEIQARLNEELDAANFQQQGVRSKIDTALSALTSDIFAQVETRKREIADEFGTQAAAVDANIEALTNDIKRATVAHGESVKGKVFHAVYVKGRVTWNTDMLDGMLIAFPALEKARKVGQPSVTLRKL